ncbi:unnamed protein product [Cochlearia groenlandica]
MTKSVFSSSSYFLTCLLLLAAASATSSIGNTTSGLLYGRCASGDTVGECITTVEAVARRILQQRRYLSPQTTQQQPTYNCKIAGNCIGTANGNRRACPLYARCR